MSAASPPSPVHDRSCTRITHSSQAIRLLLYAPDLGVLGTNPAAAGPDRSPTFLFAGSSPSVLAHLGSQGPFRRRNAGR